MALRMEGKLQQENRKEGLAVATDCCSHLRLHAGWELDLGIQKLLEQLVQEKAQEGRQGEGSRCNLEPQQLQLGKAPQPYQTEGWIKKEPKPTVTSTLGQWQN